MLISQSFFLFYEMSFCVFCLFFYGLFLFSCGIEEILSLILTLCWLCIAGVQVYYLSLSLVFLLWWQESLILMRCQYFSLWFVTFVSFKRNHSPKVINAFTHIASQVLKLFLSHVSLYSMENEFSCMVWGRESVLPLITSCASAIMKSSLSALIYSGTFVRYQVLICMSASEKYFVSLVYLHQYHLSYLFSFIIFLLSGWPVYSHLRLL